MLAPALAVLSLLLAASAHAQKGVVYSPGGRTAAPFSPVSQQWAAAVGAIYAAPGFTLDGLHFSLADLAKVDAQSEASRMLLAPLIDQFELLEVMPQDFPRMEPKEQRMFLQDAAVQAAAAVEARLSALTLGPEANPARGLAFLKEFGAYLKPAKREAFEAALQRRLAKRVGAIANALGKTNADEAVSGAMAQADVLMAIAKARVSELRAALSIDRRRALVGRLRGQAVGGAGEAVQLVIVRGLIAEARDSLGEDSFAREVWAAVETVAVHSGSGRVKGEAMAAMLVEKDPVFAEMIARIAESAKDRKSPTPPPVRTSPGLESVPGRAFGALFSLLAAAGVSFAMTGIVPTLGVASAAAIMLYLGAGAYRHEASLAGVFQLSSFIAFFHAMTAKGALPLSPGATAALAVGLLAAAALANWGFKERQNLIAFVANAVLLRVLAALLF